MIRLRDESYAEDLLELHEGKTAPKVVEVNRVLEILDDIYDALWEIDIPSPTVPEYVEHHEGVQKVMKLVKELTGNLEKEVL